MLLTAVMAAALVQSTPAQTTQQIAESYVEAMQVRDWDRLENLLSPDEFHFTDRAADQWGGTSLDVSGRDRFLQLQRSWGLSSLDWDIETSFFTGEWAVFYGIARVPGTQGPAKFLTALRVRNGLVTERHDLGDYLAAAGTTARFADESESTHEIATAYMESYAHEDWDTMRSLLADDATFQDPTAAAFGGQAGMLQEGADNIVANFRRALGPISNLQFHAEHYFAAKNHSVIVGTVSYDMPGSAFNINKETVSFSHPYLGIVEVSGGKVNWHRDYADYSAFRQQVEEQR